MDTVAPSYERVATHIVNYCCVLWQKKNPDSFSLKLKANFNNENKTKNANENNSDTRRKRFDQ